MFDFALFIASLIFLLLGANFFVNYNVKLAHKLRVSPLIIGATAVAIGTSVPEMVVSLTASLAGRGDLVMGNIIGANAANAGLILGLSFLFGKIRVGTRKTQALSRLALLITVLFVVLLLFFGGLTRFWASTLLVFAVCVFLWEIYAGERGGEVEDAILFGKRGSKIESFSSLFVVIIVSLIVVYLSGQVLVVSALKLADFFQIQAGIFGLTAVSLGTTLPELTTSVVAIFKKEGKLIVGNIIGSIIYNFLLVGGLGGIISFLPLTSFASLFSVLAMISLLAFLISRYQGRTIPRYWGIILLSTYLVFLFLSL